MWQLVWQGELAATSKAKGTTTPLFPALAFVDVNTDKLPCDAHRAVTCIIMCMSHKCILGGPHGQFSDKYLLDSPCIGVPCNRAARVLLRAGPGSVVLASGRARQ